MEIFDVDLQDIVHAAAHLKLFYYQETKREEMDIPITLVELEDYLKRKRVESIAENP